MRGLRQDFADWRRREPIWCAVVCAFAAFFTVQGVLRLVTGGPDPSFWLAVAFMYGAYIGVKLEVSRAWRMVGRVAAGRAVKMTRFDPKTGQTTVYDLSQGAVGGAR